MHIRRVSNEQALFPADQAVSLSKPLHARTPFEQLGLFSPVFVIGGLMGRIFGEVALWLDRYFTHVNINFKVRVAFERMFSGNFAYLELSPRTHPSVLSLMALSVGPRINSSPFDI